MIYYFVSFKIFVKGLNGGTFTVTPDKPSNSLHVAEMKLSRMTCDENGVFANVTIMSRSIDVVNSDSPEYMERYSYTFNSSANDLVKNEASAIMPVPTEYIKKMEDY